jgi:hypothetical protein
VIGERVPDILSIDTLSPGIFTGGKVLILAGE